MPDTPNSKKLSQRSFTLNGLQQLRNKLSASPSLQASGDGCSVLCSGQNSESRFKRSHQLRALILRNSGQVALKLIPLAHLYNAYVALNLLEHGKQFELCLVCSKCSRKIVFFFLT